MNKYKMISVSSFITACIFLLSIVLPIRSNANDKESLELNLQYENSKATINITVNSDVYTGVVCKYLVMEDVLKVDNLLEQTREHGNTINLDKNESGKYTTEIYNGDVRYVVVYVSIGNCNICDYLDCKPNNDENGGKIERTSHAESDVVPSQNLEQQSQESEAQNNSQQENSAPENQNSQNQEAQNNQDTVVVDNSTSNENQDFQVIEDNTNKQNNEQQVKEENKVDENKEVKKETTKTETTQTTTTNQAIDLKSYNDNKSEQSEAKVVDKDSIDVSNTSKDPKAQTSNTKSTDKDAITLDSFKNIEKTTTSTVDENMPKTGEDDAIKIIGLVVFSTLSIVFFYKYKMTR